MRPAHSQVFIHIDAEGTRLTTLAARAAMTPQAMAELVDDLVELGYAERIPDRDDRRAKLIVLTPAGWAAVQDAFDALIDTWNAAWSASSVPAAWPPCKPPSLRSPASCNPVPARPSPPPRTGWLHRLIEPKPSPAPPGNLDAAVGKAPERYLRSLAAEPALSVGG